MTQPETATPAIVVTLDSTLICSCDNGERHLEARVGNVETECGGCQVFGAVAKSSTPITELVRRNLDAVGQTGDTTLAAFTDGCSGLRGLLADAGVTTRPMLDWFHIAKRLQYLDWIRAVMRHYQSEPDQRRPTAPSRKVWTALRALDGYLISQSAWLVNYAERHRAGLRAGTAITEGTANFPANRQMNTSQQMRWSRRGADLLLQVRCAVYNGMLGSGFGQKFQPDGQVSLTTVLFLRRYAEFNLMSFQQQIQ